MFGEAVLLDGQPYDGLMNGLNEGGVEMEPTNGEYIVIKAHEQGVHVIGLTRGQNTKFHHTEKLDRGEILIAQFTDHTSAIKIRGKATVLTKYGTVESDD